MIAYEKNIINFQKTLWNNQNLKIFKDIHWLLKKLSNSQIV